MTKEQEAKINEYVKAYATKHHITVEQAKEHLMVSYYAEHVVNSMKQEDAKVGKI